MQTSTIHKAETEQYVINPKRFVLWLFIVASIMLFAGFTSAYIVRRGEGNWEVFKLPSMFAANTVFIICSSVFLQVANAAAKKNNFIYIKTFLGLALIMGIFFCGGQWIAWKQLIADNVYFAFSNPSNSFVYVITGLHLFHVVAGIIFMLIMFVNSIKNKIHSGARLYLNLCTTYCHFVGLLWIYLYLFLYLYR